LTNSLSASSTAQLWVFESQFLATLKIQTKYKQKFLCHFAQNYKKIYNFISRKFGGFIGNLIENENSDPKNKPDFFTKLML